jgi:uncharacterized lipoprotein YddW (UPF0748 family)
MPSRHSRLLSSGVRIRGSALLHAGLLCVVLGTASSAGEVRGVWVVRTALTSPAGVDQVVDRASDAGFNTLLVQVRGRGDAFYNSQILPRSALLRGAARDFDPLGRLLDRAHSRGIAVHAWINVLLSADFGQPLPARHELLLHPEWMMIPRSVAAVALHASGVARRQLVREAARDSDAEGFYLSPWAEGVGQHLEAIVRELVGTYAVDGVHLDFIRYPGPEYDYSHSALVAFRPGRAGRELLAAPRVEPQAWDAQRCAGVSVLAARLAAVARQTRPGVRVTAAVVPDRATALSQKSQDWAAWLAQGTLDAVCPMIYTTDDRIFRREVEDARSAAGPDKEVWAGVGAFRLSMDGVIDKLRLARAAKAEGVVLFSHEFLWRNEVARLRAALLERDAASVPPALAVPTARGPSGGR